MQNWEGEEGERFNPIQHLLFITYSLRYSSESLFHTLLIHYPYTPTTWVHTVSILIPYSMVGLCMGEGGRLKVEGWRWKVECWRWKVQFSRLAQASACASSILTKIQFNQYSRTLKIFCTTVHPIFSINYKTAITGTKRIYSSVYQTFPDLLSLMVCCVAAWIAIRYYFHFSYLPIPFPIHQDRLSISSTPFYFPVHFLKLLF